MTAVHRLTRFWHRWQLTIVTVALAALVVAVFFSEQANDEARFKDQQQVTHQLRLQDIERVHAACVDTVEFRKTFAAFLDQAARPASGVDFTQLRSFADLDEPTKRFLQELRVAQAGGANRAQDIAARYRDRFFPLPDCDAARDAAVRQLDRDGS